MQMLKMVERIRPVRAIWEVGVKIYIVKIYIGNREHDRWRLRIFLKFL